MKTSLLSALALTTTLGLGACLDSTDSNGVDTTEPGSSARIAMNSLMPTQLYMHLNSTTFNSTNTASMMSTTNGRVTLAYIYGCAFDSSTQVTISYAGVPYTFVGAVGLTPDWGRRALTSAEAGAVSACVAARLNKKGVTVSISMRGSNGGFVLGGTEATDYHLDEGTFWGNIFPDLGATSLNACAGVDKLATPTQDDLANRECTVDAGTGLTNCSLTYAGHCADVCTWDATGTYRDCSFNGVASNNAATIFLQ